MRIFLSGRRVAKLEVTMSWTVRRWRSESQWRWLRLWRRQSLCEVENSPIKGEVVGELRVYWVSVTTHTDKSGDEGVKSSKELKSSQHKVEKPQIAVWGGVREGAAGHLGFTEAEGFPRGTVLEAAAGVGRSSLLSSGLRNKWLREAQFRLPEKVQEKQSHGGQPGFM